STCVILLANSPGGGAGAAGPPRRFFFAPGSGGKAARTRRKTKCILEGKALQTSHLSKPAVSCVAMWATEEREMVARSSRIDPRVKRTRKLLLDAFMGVIAEKSFDEITVQDITARATVNRATFYAHFVDKYALVDELIREGFTQMLQQCMATPAHSTEEQVRRLIRAVCDYWTELH